MNNSQIIKGISNLIHHIQGNIKKIVIEISANAQTFESLRNEVLSGSDMNERINRMSDDTLDLINQISAALLEQKSAMDQILQNIESINIASSENSDGLEQIAHAISDVNLKGDELTMITCQFKTENSSADTD